MEKLSTFIITKNEADRIARCIKTVSSISDEIIIVDSGSSDGTQDIASSLGAKVIYNKWPGYGPQKKFAESQCTYDWILNLDADEFLDDAAVCIIKAALDSPKHAAFRLYLQNLYPLEEKVHPWSHKEKLIRLYNKQKAGYKDSVVHDRVLVREGSVKQLKAVISHQSMRNLSHWTRKNDSYSSALAQDAFNKKVRVSLLKILFAYPAGFLKAFFLRRFCVYGINGLIYAHLFAHFRLMKFSKLKELYRHKQQ